MQVVLINGSPRLEGNTAEAVAMMADHLVAAGDTVHRVDVVSLLRGRELAFCHHCSDPCHGTCYRGTALEAALQELSQADGVIAGSPVYFGTVSSPLKAFWDFTRMLRTQHSLLYTVGSAFAVGAARFGGQETTVNAVHDMFLIQGMILVGDSSRAGIGHQGGALQSGDRWDEAQLDHWMTGFREVLMATQPLRERRRSE